jgi:hypothetical protein
MAEGRTMSSVVERVKKKRLRFKQTQSVEERLAADTAELREQLKLLPHGPTRDQCFAKDQNETAIELSEWLRSPHLQSPT